MPEGLSFFTRNASEPFLNQASSELGVCFFFWFFLKKTEKEGLLKMILKYKMYKPTVFFCCFFFRALEGCGDVIQMLWFVKRYSLQTNG